ncbi:hypothetical protein HD806DRAFT_529539 [Xylariaceae sp. AK1471]|nr:hypothetical protein HD806DRAFT_529539 [Xylariaceae sp. AK1471]
MEIRNVVEWITAIWGAYLISQAEPPAGLIDASSTLRLTGIKTSEGDSSTAPGTITEIIVTEVTIAEITITKPAITKTTTMTRATLTKTTTTQITVTVSETSTPAKGELAAKSTAVPDCNFHSLQLLASLLKAPLDLTASINLEEWQAAKLQLNELQRLLHNHRKTIIKREGSQEYDRLLADLTSLVEKPLRDGCAALERFQRQLLEFELKFPDTESNGERSPTLGDLLHEAVVDILKWNPGKTHLLPSWARQTPELQSNGCPNRDCFKVGDVALDVFTLGIPRTLLDGVMKIQTDTELYRMYKTKSVKDHIIEIVNLRLKPQYPRFANALRNMTEFLKWAYASFAKILTSSVLGMAFVQGFLLILLYILTHEYVREQLYNMPTRVGGLV